MTNSHMWLVAIVLDTAALNEYELLIVLKYQWFGVPRSLNAITMYFQSGHIKALFTRDTILR